MSAGSSLRVAVASPGRFHMFDLARQLRSLGTDVRLFTGHPMFKLDPDLRAVARTRSRWVLAEHFNTRMPGPRSSWLRVQTLQDFGRWLDRSLGDEVDVLDALDGSGLEAGRRVRDAGKVWICNRGSSHVLAQKRQLGEEYRRWGVRMPGHFFPPAYLDRCLAEYEGSDGIVVGSTFSRSTFIDEGLPAGKVHVCPYGVDLSLFRQVPKQDDRFRILFVGRLSLRKGIGYLLEAVRPLVERGLVELWMIGEKSAETRTLLERNRDLFIYKGSMPRRELAWHYSQGSVLVLPSIEEGLALVQAQAMACGLPVIATRNTGAEDLFTDGIEGMFIPVRSPAAIRHAIEWMLDHPEKRAEMAAAALLRVKDLGGWDAYGRRCLEVYRTLTGRKRAPQGPALSAVSRLGSR